MAFVYLAESNGARLVRYGTTTAAQVTSGGTTTVEFQAYTWDLMPAGEVGDVIFRQVDLTMKTAASLTVAVTPVLDGVAQATQTVSTPAAGVVAFQVPIPQSFARATRLALQIATVGRTADVELHQAEVELTIIRQAP